LASGNEGCYSWGNNCYGQLGVSNPLLTEFSLVPLRIPLPEGMIVKTLAAGGIYVTI
jgi:hypothetical protein